MNDLVQVFASFTGSLGFAMLYHLHGKKLWMSGIGGMVCWASYLGFSHISKSLFIANLLATVVATVYAEIMARILKTPVTVFLISAIIPMVPGGTLYYTMNYAIAKNWALFYVFGQKTIVIAVAMAGGIMIASSVFRLANEMRFYYRRK